MCIWFIELLYDFVNKNIPFCLYYSKHPLFIPVWHQVNGWLQWFDQWEVCIYLEPATHIQMHTSMQYINRESKLQLGYVCLEGNGKNDNYLVIYVFLSFYWLSKHSNCTMRPFCVRQLWLKINVSYLAWVYIYLTLSKKEM